MSKFLLVIHELTCCVLLVVILSVKPHVGWSEASWGITSLPAHHHNIQAQNSMHLLAIHWLHVQGMML